MTILRILCTTTIHLSNLLFLLQTILKISTSNILFDLYETEGEEGETGKKFSIQLKKHAKSKAKWDDKSLFGKHRNDEGHSSEVVEQKLETLHTETSTRRRRP